MGRIGRVACTGVVLHGDNKLDGLGGSPQSWSEVETGEAFTVPNPRLLTVAVALAAMLLAATLACQASAANAFSNPVVPESSSGADSPDPWLFRHRDRYYLTHTTGNRVILRSSRSLSGLADARPKTVWWPGRGPAEAGSNIWAPEFHRLDGPGGKRWYVYYTAGPGDVNFQRMHVLEGPRGDPFGPYRYLDELDVGEAFAIDADVFSTGGRTYALYSAADTNSFTPTSLYIVELGDPVTVSRGPIEISEPEYPWEQVIFSTNEGPQALFRDGLLHVIYSASFCGTGAYKMGRLTVPIDADLLNPATWVGSKHRQPVFQASESAGVYGTGHGSFFTSPNGRESWMTYHATDDTLGCFTGGVRLTHAKPFTWRKNGNPNFGEPVALDRPLPRPGGDPSRALQVEDHLRPARRGARREVASRRLVGGLGVVLGPDRSGALGSFVLRGNKSRKLRVAVRVLLDSPGLRLLLRGGRSGPKLATARAGGEPGQAEELRFGAIRLRPGVTRLTLALPKSADDRPTADQIRITRVGGR